MEQTPHTPSSVAADALEGATDLRNEDDLDLGFVDFMDFAIMDYPV